MQSGITTRRRGRWARTDGNVGRTDAQVFLEDRFRLKTHRETRMPVYAMSGKGRPQRQLLAEGACTLD
jgi:hypothetical protein